MKQIENFISSTSRVANVKIYFLTTLHEFVYLQPWIKQEEKQGTQMTKLMMLALCDRRNPFTSHTRLFFLP